MIAKRRASAQEHENATRVVGRWQQHVAMAPQAPMSFAPGLCHGTQDSHHFLAVIPTNAGIHLAFSQKSTAEDRCRRG
jgi:hypothetical protein